MRIVAVVAVVVVVRARWKGGARSEEGNKMTSRGDHSDCLHRLRLEDARNLLPISSSWFGEVFILN